MPDRQYTPGKSTVASSLEESPTSTPGRSTRVQADAASAHAASSGLTGVTGTSGPQSCVGGIQWADNNNHYDVHIKASLSNTTGGPQWIEYKTSNSRIVVNGQKGSWVAINAKDPELVLDTPGASAEIDNDPNGDSAYPLEHWAHPPISSPPVQINLQQAKAQHYQNAGILYQTVWSWDFKAGSVNTQGTVVQGPAPLGSFTVTWLMSGVVSPQNNLINDFLSVVHEILGAAAIIPGYGRIPGLIDAAIYIGQGDWANAAVSALGPLADIAKAARVASAGSALAEGEPAATDALTKFYSFVGAASSVYGAKSEADNLKNATLAALDAYKTLAGKKKSAG